MNYYLARDGQTYGPYPEETFPAMLQAGQVIAEDLVCPEGGTQWVALNQVPALAASLGPAAPAAPAEPAAPAAGGLGLKLGEHSEPVASASPAAGTPYRPGHALQAERAGVMARASDAFDKVKNALYLVGALVVAGILIAGFMAAQGEKKAIAKLQSEPGWGAFERANNQIDSEASLAGYGNTTFAATTSKAIAVALQEAQKKNFAFEKGSSAGRSKLGKVLSAVDAATAGNGRFQTFLELRDDRAIFLIHVPEYSRYKDDIRDTMREICWRNAHRDLSALVQLKGDLPIIVGVRDKSSYDCVFEGRCGKTQAEMTSGNVPSHKVLVKWFGTERL